MKTRRRQNSSYVRHFQSVSTSFQKHIVLLEIVALANSKKNRNIKANDVNPPSPSEFPMIFRGGGEGGMDIFWNHTLLLWQFNHLCAIGRHISAVLCRCFKAICLLEFYPNMASITGFNFSSWNTLVIDGHDVEAVCKAFYEAKTTKGRPTAILAKTYKGKGVEGMVIGHMH